MGRVIVGPNVVVFPEKSGRSFWVVKRQRVSLCLNRFRLAFVSSNLLAVQTGGTFATVLHVIFVDGQGFVDFGTEGIIIVNPITMSVSSKGFQHGIELTGQVIPHFPSLEACP